MAINERPRHELYLRLEDTLGPEAATTLMEHLPPVGWADVATKRDLDQTTALFRRDLDQTTDMLRSDLDQTAALLRSDLDHLAATTKRDLDHLADRLIAVLRDEILTHVAGQNRAMALTVIGTILATATLAFTAARFF